jgi:hypothetical protein
VSLMLGAVETLGGAHGVTHLRTAQCARARRRMRTLNVAGREGVRVQLRHPM